MTHDLVILFIHHRLDAVTMNNLLSFQINNPGIPIITISGAEKIQDGVGAEDLPDFYRLRQRYDGTDWMYRSGLDIMLVNWYKLRNIESKRWFLVEWDGWCGMPVREFLGEVWDADVVVPSVRWPNREPEWYWFHQIQRLPPEYRPYAVGTVPTCFTMLSDRALQAISERLTGDVAGHIIYEIRLPTLAHASGYPPVVNPRAGWNITWKEIHKHTPLSRNLWHPIKWMVSPGDCSTLCFDSRLLVPMIVPNGPQLNT